MSIIGRNRQLFLVATLATLALRALAPDGYMPGSADSGLLYELCPEGMPVEIMQALAGDNQHHHHHGGDSEAASASSSEQCPIGHMLASAIAMDSTPASDMLPAAPSYNDGSVAVLFHTPAIGYRSRAPPA
jgi:hypothetical protein